MTMSERETRTADEPDILAELQAEVARDLADERPPAGGPAYQIVAALRGPRRSASVRRFSPTATGSGRSGGPARDCGPSRSRS